LQSTLRDPLLEVTQGERPLTLEGLIFGGIGCLSECADVDRTAWNTAFRTHGVGWQWSWDDYADLMRAGGDRQLVSSYAVKIGEICPVPAEILDATHQKIFASMMTREVPLRPGVARVLNWSVRAGVKLGFVSRAGQEPVRALLQSTARARAGIAFDVAVLRDDVRRLAPHPEAMEHAVAHLNVGRERIVVVADTPATAQAAQSAGLAVLAFPGLLSEGCPEDFAHLPVAQVLSPEGLIGAWNSGLETAAE
jgi:beta-phosphoglucomutase-like phosphatase (HAD superfamily)